MSISKKYYVLEETEIRKTYSQSFIFSLLKNIYLFFQEPLNGLTPNTDVDIDIVTPRKKSIGSDEVIIDMHLHNNINHTNHIESIKRI